MKFEISKLYSRLLIGAAVVIVGCCFQNCSSNSSDSTTPAVSSSGSKYPNQMQLSGISASHGIFDASLAQDPASSTIWMSYSAVNPSVMWPTQNFDVVSTGLAYSNDQGLSWKDSGGIVNSTSDVNLALPAPSNAGTWQSEVSSLVFDAAAPLNQRWKLIWHHYLNINNGRHFEHGWIALKMAASPAQLASAAEIKLFSGSIYDVGNNTAGGGSGSPLGGAPAIALSTALDSHLNNCAVFTEPSLLATSSGLYLNLLCGAAPTDQRMIILKCANPCNPVLAASWTYLGVALNNADALSFGFNEGFSGGNLVSTSSGVYLLATPVSTAPFDGFYNGCVAFKFTNIDTASLQRSVGVPTTILKVNGDVGSFNGACTYWPGATQPGIIYDQLSSVGLKFRLMNSGVSL